MQNHQNFSALHRITSDELWIYAGGDTPISLALLHPTQGYQHMLIGEPSRHAGAVLHYIVPANTWFAARPLADSWAMASCVVAPGFDFANFELATVETLQHSALLQQHFSAFVR